MKPHYSEEESNDILRRAIEKMPLKDAMSLEQLEKIGSEIGITPEALRQAEAEHRADVERREAYARFLIRERAEFKDHVLKFIGINAFLFFINHYVTPGFYWCVFPFLGMGLNLYQHWVKATVRDTQEHIDAYNEWLKQNQPKVLPPGIGASRPPRL
jgi:hypothetical protein